MKLVAVFLVLLLLFFTLCYSQTFQHPGVLVSQSQLDYIKAQVTAKTEPFYTAYTKAINSNYGSLTYKAQGPPESGVIDCGSYSNPDYGCSEDDSDSTTAYLQSLLWYISENKQYASNVITLLNKYGNELKNFNNSNAPLQAAWSAQKWTRAAEIIRHTNAGWSSSDISTYSSLLSKVYLPLIYDGSDANGNWELSMIDAMFGISVFTEDWSLFNHSVTFWKQRVPAYFYYEPIDGDAPKKAPRGSPSWYGEAIFNSSVNGLCQETCRDLGHTQYGIASTLNGAETAAIQGVDLYGSEVERIIAALEFNANILLGAKIPDYLCGDGKVNIDQYPTFEIGYNQYHNRKGESLPHTLQQIITHVRNMDDLTDGHIAVWETLTHGGSPNK